MVQAVRLDLALVGLLALFLGQLPVGFGDDGFVDAVVEHVVLLLDDVVLVAGAGHLFIAPAPVGQLAAVYGVVQHADEEGARERLPRVVVAADLAVTVLVEPLGNPGRAHGGVDVDVYKRQGHSGPIRKNGFCKCIGGIDDGKESAQCEELLGRNCSLR